MKIAILGAGNIGGTMGKKWVDAGREVVFGVRDANSEKTQAALQSTGGKAQAVSVAEAIAGSEVILVSVPWSAVPGVVEEHGDALAGKVLIDATNNFGGPVINNIDVIQSHVQGAKVYRAFNAIGWQVFEQPIIDGVQVDLFYTGPDGDARQAVEGLIRDVGTRPLWVGENDLAPVVDNLGLLWINLIRQRGMSRRVALKLLGS